MKRISAQTYRSLTPPAQQKCGWDPPLVREGPGPAKDGKPGLEFGPHNLTRTEVAELTAYLQHWLKTGRGCGV